MKHTSIYLVLVGIILSTQVLSSQNTSYVDPRIGTTGGGNVFPGPSLPYGMVKIGPDCGDKSANAGYSPDGGIHGFSHTHVNGTGGGPKYGNILFMPGIGEIKPNGHTSLRDSETFKVGYYATTFSGTGIKTELTCTHSCGFHRYTFPAADNAFILVDAGSFLTTAYWGEGQSLVGSEIEIVNDHEIRGYSCVRGGWNIGEAYTVYFHAVFDASAASYGTWKGDQLENDVMLQYDEGVPTGGYLQFNTSPGQSVKVKVGISFLSTEKAKANLMEEIPHWDFDQICNEADAAWENLLSKVQIEGGTESQKRIFYSSLYRIFLQPADKTGENPKWSTDRPYYDDFYAIWDTYRATHPFISLVNENRQVDMINALIDIYKNEEYMPDARSGFCNGRTQGGSNNDVLVADAFVKKLKGIDYEEAFSSMIKNAEVPPGGNEQKEGRGGIPDYNNLGYVSINYERSGTRTLEFAYNDWCIAQVAKGLGKEDAIIQKYLQRSGNWQNLWRPVSSEGFTGFIMPRNADGTWWDGSGFTVHSAGSWGDVFYESNSWEYSLYVPQDVNKLIEKCGGTETFIDRLDTFFNKGYFNVSNEPGFFTPCLYNYAGVQHKTAKKVRDILTSHYRDTPGGVPGNDDSGSMAAWFCFHALGFFPNAGQDLYLISSPIFEKVVIKMDNGKTFTITSPNSSEKNIYIESAILNGEPLNRSWFRHTDIMDGGTLEFVMTDQPVRWDVGELPPSESVITGGVVETTSITIAANTQSVTAGESVSFSVTDLQPSDASNKNVTYAIISGNEYGSVIATTGVLSTTGAGQIQVQATAVDGSNIKSNIVTITVNEGSSTDCDPIRIVRIKTYGENDKPVLYLLDNGGTLTWSATISENSAWYEIPVDNSTTDFYYKNVATQNYIYRPGTKTTIDWDWDSENAALSATNPKTALYQFRPVATEWDWGGRYYIVNVANADFNNITNRGAFILNAVNYDWSVLDWNDGNNVWIGGMPNNSNVWASSALDVVNGSAKNPDCTKTDDNIGEEKYCPVSGNSAVFAYGSPNTDYPNPNVNNNVLQDMNGKTGNWGEFRQVEGGIGGAAEICLMYSKGYASEGMCLSVNDGPLTPIHFPSTGNWDTYDNACFPVTLLPGATNKIRFEICDHDGINIGCLTVKYPSITVALTNEEEKTATFYPNPASDYLIFYAPEKAVLRFYDLLGHLMGQYELKQGNNTISVTNYPTGVYLFEMRMANGNEKGKWMKK